MYKLYCLQCGCEFEHRTRLKVYCDECIDKRQKERNIKYMRERRKVRSKKNKILQKPKSIGEVISEMEAYNKEHGTKLTYGQYTQMICK